MTDKSSEPVFEVLWPLSRKVIHARDAAQRLPDLNGKVVCELWDAIFRGEAIFPMVREFIRKRFPGVKFVTYEEFGNFHGALEYEISASLPEKLKQHKADAVIVGVGA
jgi:hypothetical protein